MAYFTTTHENVLTGIASSFAGDTNHIIIEELIIAGNF